MSSIQLSNTVFDKTYAQYTGSGSAGANTQVIQTAFTLNSASVNGSPVTIAANGNMTFNKSGIHHITISVAETTSPASGSAIIPNLTIAGGATLLNSRVLFYGSFSGDVIIDSSKTYNFQLIAASSTVLTAQYTITIRRVGTA